MTVPAQPRTVPTSVGWSSLSEKSARVAAGSASTLLGLAEAATLASAAWLRTAVDLFRPSPEVTTDASGGDTAVAVEDVPVEHVQVGDVPVEAVPAPAVLHWDELNLASIRGHLSRLSLDDLRSLLIYEHAHASRGPVLTMLENRIRKTGGEPSGQVAVTTPE